MEPSSQQSDQAREVGRALAKSRETEALSVLNLPNYRIAALSQVPNTTLLIEIMPMLRPAKP